MLGAEFGISRATAYRYVAEGIAVLAVQRPDLREALLQRAARGPSQGSARDGPVGPGLARVEDGPVRTAAGVSVPRGACGPLRPVTRSLFVRWGVSMRMPGSRAA